jgi:hypothetical protein
VQRVPLFHTVLLSVWGLMSLGVPPLHEKQALHIFCGACSLEVMVSPSR